MTYTYRCPKCGTFERQESIKAEPLKECPKCKCPVHRVVTGGIGLTIYNAPGFYCNS